MTPITDDEIDAIPLPQPIPPARNPRVLSDDLIDQIQPAPSGSEPPAGASGIQPPPPVYDIRATTHGAPPLATPDAAEVLANSSAIPEAIPTGTDVLRHAGQLSGYAGNVAKGAAADAFALGRSLTAGTGPRTGGNVEAALSGEPLPVDAELTQLRQEERQQKLVPWRSAGANIALGAVKALPKIAAIGATGGGAAALGATRMGTLLTEMITAGGLFGVDDDGNFHPKEAAIGAAIPGVGAASRLVVAKAIGETLARGGGEALANPTAQKVLETLGEQVGINAFTLAMDMPTLAQLYKSNPTEFQAHLTELIGGNLAFALLGVRKITDAKIPSETRDWIIRNADSLSRKEILASIPPEVLSDIFGRYKRAQSVDQSMPDVLARAAQGNPDPTFLKSYEDLLRAHAPKLTPEEQTIGAMIDRSLQEGGENFKKNAGALVIGHSWPRLLAKTLGVEEQYGYIIHSAEPIVGNGKPTGGRKRALLGLPTTGEANANRQPSPVEETGGQETPGIQTPGSGAAGTVQAPAQTGQEPGPASQVQTEAKPVEPKVALKPDMATARRVAEMSPDVFKQSFPGGFNRINIPIGQSASDADLKELEKLHAAATNRVMRLMDKAQKTGKEEDIENFTQLSTLPQFFAEAIAHAKAVRAPGQAPPAPKPLEEPTVPELPATIEAQMQMLKDRKRNVVMITKGEKTPPVPKEFRMRSSPVGGFIYNPATIDGPAIDAAIKEDRLGDILGYGISRKPVKGTEIGAVVVRGKDGVEKWGVLTDQEHLQSVMDAAKRVAGADDKIALEPEAEVIAKRNPLKIKPTGTPTNRDKRPPWQIPREEYMNFTSEGVPLTSEAGEIWKVHRGQSHLREVLMALNKGQPVPPEVQKDYPDLNFKKFEQLQTLGMRVSYTSSKGEKWLGVVVAKHPPPDLKRDDIPRYDVKFDNGRMIKGLHPNDLTVEIERPAARKAGDLEGLTEAELDALLDEASVAKAPAKKAQRSPASGKKPTVSKWKLIGKNSEGYELFEDENGVRSIMEGTIRVTEPVELIPTLEGYKPNVGARKGTRFERFEKPNEKTASDIAADAAKAGVKGVDEAIRGLHKLFGGGKHLGTGPSFDEKTYEEAKPHFENAWEQFRKAGKSLADFLRFILEKFGAGARAYIKRFIQEKQAGLQITAKPPTVEQQPNVDQPAESPGSGVSPGGEQPAAPGATGPRTEAPAPPPRPSEPVQPGVRPADEGTAGSPQPGGNGAVVPDANGVPTQPSPAAAQPAPEQTSGGAVEGVPGKPPEPAVAASPAVTTASPELKNLRLTESPAPTGPVARVAANLRAIEIVKRLEKEQRPPTDDERKELSAWSGWGSFKELFNEGRAEKREYDPGWAKRYGKPFDKLKALLTEKEFNAAAESSVNAHYTSPEAIKAMWTLAKRLGFRGGRVLESAIGRGDFIGFAPSDIYRKLRWTAVELDPITAKIASYLYPEADLRAQGFEDAKLPRGHYDLNITNVPFHEVGPGKEYPTMNLHNYFIARGLDMLKPGGLLVVITTKGTMDLRPDQRKILADKGQLIGAIRLPNNAFKESAATEVVTDILVLRKPDGKPFDLAQPWTNTGTIESGDDKFTVNEYYVAHPEMILGKNAFTGTMYRKDEYTVEGTGPLEPKLLAAVSKFPENISFQEPAKAGESIEPTITTMEDYTLSLNEKNQVVEAHNFQLGKPVWDTGNAALTKRAREYVKLRNVLMDQYALERNPASADADIEDNRKKLRTHYDAWVKGNGTLNQNDRKTSYLSSDPGYYTVMGLENVSEEVDPTNPARTLTIVRPADILARRMILPDIAPAKAANAADALGVSMSYKGELDLDYIRELTGLTDDQIEAELIAANLGFKDPESGRLLTSAEYLTGEVRDKLAKAMFAAKDNDLFSRNVEALKAVIPETVPFDRVSVDISARWTPVTVLNKFAVQTLGLPDNIITFVPVVEEFAVKPVNRLSNLSQSEWSTKDMTAPDLLQHALNFKRALVQKYDPVNEKYVKDEGGTALANTLIDKIKAEYAKWIRQTNETVPYKFFDPQRGEYRTEALPIWEVMEREFNRVANSFVVPDHDGSNLKLPHLSQQVRRTQHLLNGVQRAINQGAAVFAHGVGSGKTFLGVVLGHELQRIGLSKKFVHVIKKPTVDQYRVSIQRAYPGSRVLIPSKKDFEPANRKKLIARIASTKWDFIILTHEQFKSISPGAEMVEAFFKAQIDQLRQILKDEGGSEKDEDAKSTRGMAPQIRNIVRKIKGLKKRMTTHLDSIKNHQDKGSAWENLGIDGLFIDESHNFKKMPLATNMEGEVKGIPNDFSQRAVDLLVKVRDIQQKTEGRNIFFASGTPVSNTLAELWIQFNATAPQLLKEFSIETFDSFASTYADVVTVFEMGWDNSFRDVTRMARFKNPAGLTTLTRMGMDVKIGNKELGIDVPDIEGGKPKVHVIKATKSFDRWIEFLDAISEEWETLDPKGRFLNSWVPIATMRAGVAAALDPRCVFPDSPDDPNSKVNTCIGHIFDEWARGQIDRTTMMVFADMYRTLNSAKLRDFLGKNAPPAPELEVPPETSDDTGDTGAADQAAFEKMAVGEFNLYHDIRRKLIARGVPEHEIGVITEHDTDAKRDALFNKVRNGIVRILIGSTEKIGEGVDVPQRMSAQFHLDPPMAMTPAKMEQRIGRIIRQGNMFSVKQRNIPVRLNLYAQEKSMDAAIYQMLETKGTMVIQALKGQFLGDSFEDPASELTMAMAEMKAAATGDTRVIELAKLIKEVRDLSMAEGAHYRRVSELRRSIEEEGRASRSDTHGATQDKKISEVTAAIVADPEKMSMLHIRSQTRITGEEAIKEWLKKARAAADETLSKPDMETAASFIFNDKLRVSYQGRHKAWYVGSPDETHKIYHSATFWIGGPDPLWSDARYDSDITSIESILAVLKGIPERAAKKSEAELASATKHQELAQAYEEQLAATKFNEADALAAKKQALNYLESQLRGEKDARKDARKKAREAKTKTELDVPPDAQAEVTNESESRELAAEARELKAQGLEELRELLNHPKAGLSGDVVRVALDLLDQPVMKSLDWDRLRVDLKNRIAGNVAGSSRVSRWLIEMTRAARPTTLPHEVFHFLYEMLPDADRDRVDQLRREALTGELRAWGDAMPAEVRSAIEQMLGDGMSSRDFGKLIAGLKDENPQSAEWLLSLYHLINPSEYLAGIGARQFTDDSFSKKNQGWIRKLFERLKGWLQAILDAFKRLRGVPPDIRQIIRELLSGRYRNTPEGGAKAEAWAEEQHSIEEDEATAVPTRVFGVDDFVRDREQITPSSTQASVDYAKSIFDSAKVPVSLDTAGLWTIDNPGFDLNAEGRRLLQLLKKEIASKNEPGKPGDLLASLLNAIVYNFKLGTMDVFDRPLREELYQAAQADRSQRGLQLGALAMHLPDLQFAGQNLDVTLSRIWSDAYGGDELRSIVSRVLEHFRDWFSDEEINRALASKPELAELVEKIIAMNRRDDGGRVYRRAQAMLKPKMKKTLERMESDARVDEAVAHIIETAKRLGIEPKPNPNKKLSPLQSLLVMVTPETAEKIDAAVAKAVMDAERNAGIKAQIKAATNEAEREDWRGRFEAGEEPDPDMVEEGLNLPEFNHWKWLRESLLAYSPTTLKLVRDLVRADFKGTRFGKDLVRPADTRLDLEKMAKQPDGEIDRGLDAYVQNLQANMDLADATQETKDRVSAMIEGQVREQIERMRGRIRDVLFKEPPAPGTKLTPEQQLAQLVNAKLFADPRLDVADMVARVAAKSKIRRLAPNVTDLIKDVLATPFYRHDELGKMFADNLIGQLGVPADQADHARAVFEEAFRQPFEKARAKALEQAKAALTPQERRKIKPGAALWLKIERMVNAGGFDSGQIIQDIARAKGWTIPTDQQVRHMRNLAESEMRLRELTPQEKAVVGDDPRAIEKAKADRAAATLEKRAAIVKQMGTIWARFTRPVSGRHLWATRKNIAAAANEFEVANMLLKVGFGFRLPTHILTQLLVHIPTRAIGDAILAHKDELAAGNPSSLWKQTGTSLADAYTAALKGIRPALASARAALAGRGEARNVDRLMSGIHLFERTDDKAKELAAQGDHARASILRIMGLAKFALRFVQAVDNFQGIPAEYASMVEQVRTSLREQGRSPAEITASLDSIFGSMKLKRDAALAKAREILNASNLAAGEKELKETAWNIVRSRIYEDMRDLGLPADSFREMNEKLRRTIAWQERTSHGPGGLMATVGRGVSSLLQEVGLPMSFTRFANAIGTGINYMLMFTPAYALANARIPGITPNEPSPWFETEHDIMQRRVQALLGSILGALIMALIFSGAVVVRLFWPKDKEERDLWEAQGHRPGTLEFRINDHEFIPISLTVGPGSLVAPYAAAAGSVMDMIDQRQKAQAKLNMEAQKRGLTPGKVRPLDTADWLTVAGESAWATLMGNKALSGVAQSMTEFGIPNSKKTAAAYVSPLVLGLPQWQEFTRMLGVQMDSKIASFWDYLVPLPTSGARAVNMLGDPVGTPDAVQRVFQNIFAGSYPWVVDENAVKGLAPYAALFASGYRPPSINAGQGHAINGEWRPLTDDELVSYTVSRGHNMAREFGELGPGADMQSMKGAYQRANEAALSLIGVDTTVKTIPPVGSVSPGVVQGTGGPGRVSPYTSARRAVGASGRLGVGAPVSGVRKATVGMGGLRRPALRGVGKPHSGLRGGASLKGTSDLKKRPPSRLRGLHR